MIPTPLPPSHEALVNNIAKHKHCKKQHKNNRDFNENVHLPRTLTTPQLGLGTPFGTFDVKTRAFWIST